MESFIKAIGAIVVLAVLLCLSPLIGVLAGAFSGWIVGLFFSDVILWFLTKVGVDTAGLEVWHVGVALGFLGSFFRPSITTNSSK